MDAHEDSARALLNTAGLRATRGRLRVLGLLAGQDAPRSHADVAEALEGEGLDRTSVFRNLRDLAAAGLPHRFDPGDHVWRYELRTAAAGHPHIICRDCGTVRCAAGVSVAIEGADPALMARGLEVQLQGLCDDCA